MLTNEVPAGFIIEMLKALEIGHVKWLTLMGGMRG
jgi:hypothetical protein